MQIQTVALFCEAESHAKHVMEADEAICIGAPPATNSYLRGDHIVEVAKRLSVDAIHPGYGFLSENAGFAESVARAGIEFIGPPASAITAMGSKSESKRIMEAAGVPIVPGYYGDDQSPEFLAKEAQKVGFPVLIKAVSGGGGKGMKIVDTAEDFPLMLESAKREAVNFFKDNRVLLERYIKFPRHIECQIFCDKHGNGVFFFERDCSVQRRYQKVLEEAPAPHLSSEMRQRIGDVALQAAKAVGYVGAGTVEFIFDTETDDFYFMEMNTRLQVEHPVTEEVCQVKGRPLDLVRLQIRTAMGKPLNFSQDDISLVGSCIEARVYAESPEKGFLPESGKLAFIREPSSIENGSSRIRLDTGFRQGDEVLVHYDPMIAKLIVWGKNRSVALRGLRRALDDYQIGGINTNIEFLKRCCETPAFIEGGVTTNFINENESTLLKTPALSTEIGVMAAMAYLVHQSGTWDMSFRINSDFETSVHFMDGPIAVPVKIRMNAAQNGPFSFEVLGRNGTFSVEADRPAVGAGANSAVHNLVFFFGSGKRYSIHTVVTDRDISVIGSFGVHKIRLAPLRDDFGDASALSGGSSRIASPMPGKVSKLLVKSGDRVRSGQVIMILEAMKMEHPIKALSEGIASFFVKEGEMVGADISIASVAPDA